MDKQEIIEGMAKMDWKPASRGGIVVEKAAFDKYVSKLNPDDRYAAQQLVFEHDAGKAKGGRGYFAGLPRGESRVGKRGGQAGAGGYAFYSEQFVMAPNELTTAIRSGNEKFQRAYEAYVQEHPADLSLEHAVRVITSVPGWRMEEQAMRSGTGPDESVGTPERLAIMPTSQGQLYGAISERAANMTQARAIADFLGKNSTGFNNTTEVHGQLAEDIGQAVERADRAAARQREIAANKEAFEKQPSSLSEGAMETIRNGLRQAGHLGADEIPPEKPGWGLK